MVCECPPEYYCGTDGQGKRMDYQQRAELNCGSVEFVAPQEYMVRQTLLVCISLLLCQVHAQAAVYIACNQHAAP